MIKKLIFLFLALTAPQVYAEKWNPAEAHKRIDYLYKEATAPYANMRTRFEHDAYLNIARACAVKFNTNPLSFEAKPFATTQSAKRVKHEPQKINCEGLFKPILAVCGSWDVTHLTPMERRFEDGYPVIKRDWRNQYFEIHLSCKLNKDLPSERLILEYHLPDVKEPFQTKVLPDGRTVTETIASLKFPYLFDTNMEPYRSSVRVRVRD